MKLPRFSIREVMMLTAIIALLIPYIYRRFEKQEAFNFSYNELKQMVTKIEPGATLISGGGGREFSDMTFLMPEGTGGDLVTKIHALIDKQIASEHWKIYGSGRGGDGNGLTQFSYDLAKDNNRCRLQLLRVSREIENSWDHRTGMDRIRLILFSTNYSSN